MGTRFKITRYPSSVATRLLERNLGGSISMVRALAPRRVGTTICTIVGFRATRMFIAQRIAHAIVSALPRDPSVTLTGQTFATVDLSVLEATVRSFQPSLCIFKGCQLIFLVGL